jgi:hypothetical protein
MRPRLLNIAMAGGLLLTALGITSAARSSSVPADGVSCGAIHATSSQGVDTFAVRAVGVSCGLAKKTTSVWTINDCGAQCCGRKPSSQKDRKSLCDRSGFRSRVNEVHGPATHIHLAQNGSVRPRKQVLVEKLVGRRLI